MTCQKDIKGLKNHQGSSRSVLPCTISTYTYHIFQHNFNMVRGFFFGRPRISQVSLDPGGSGGRQDWCLEGPCHETQGDIPISEPSGGRKASHEPGGSPLLSPLLLGKMLGTQKLTKMKNIPLLMMLMVMFSMFFSLAQSRSFNMFKR